MNILKVITWKSDSRAKLSQRPVRFSYSIKFMLKKAENFTD